MVGCFEFTNPYVGLKREYFDFVAYHNYSHFDTFSAIFAFAVLLTYTAIVYLITKFVLSLFYKIFFNKNLRIFKSQLDIVNIISLTIALSFAIYYFFSRVCGTE